MRKKRLLTFEDLYNFVSNHNLGNFSAAETGYQLCVQAPAVFEKEESEDPYTLYANCLVMHTALNRNHSYVTENAVTRAMKNLAYKPVLANFCEIDDVRDFTSHDFTVDEDGNYIYYEHQIGCFTADKPELRDTDDDERKDLWARVAIPREYTDAADIIERKGGTKVSVELCINAFEYDVKEKQIIYTDIEITGLTCLGVNPETGEEVQEGMKGASIQLENFSRENNSVMQHIINEVTQSVLEQISNKNPEGKEENDMGKNEEMMSPAVIEGTIFEEAAEEEVTPEEEPVTEEEPVQEEEAPTTEEEETAEKEVYEEVIEEESNPSGPEGTKQFTINGVTFEVSLSDIQMALWDLVNDTYAANDNDYYSVEVYQDSKTVVMSAWYSNKHYRQSYKVRNDVYSLTGDRVPVKPVFVTADEEAELDRMRKNYSAISEELAKFKAEPEKMEILNSSEYLNIADTKDFEALKDINKHFDLSVDELKSQCDKMLLDFAKGNKINFEKAPEEKKHTGLKLFAKTPARKQKRYGDLFD